MAPSLIYALSNNVHYYGITLMTPPILVILLSIKTTISALTFKVPIIPPIREDNSLRISQNSSSF